MPAVTKSLTAATQAITPGLKSEGRAGGATGKMVV
jgi:hypothetical protein